ncbi:MAG: methylmalonyl Co-A mutase-associated GTPase MeaB [Rhodospirillales bacterium]|nr:methylmalonyl Co-A mutase-associated GTPase MeaB [Rhodospirillales bacterium]
MTAGPHGPGRGPPVADILAGDRRALAAAITLIESTREEDREPAEDLLQALLPHAGKAVRLGISGAPGVGKSTFIEAFGTRAIAAGRRLAVLAIDPSSERSGGSILGDKTRMPELARSEKSFIRATPASGTLGGVARRTRDAMIACEAAGFDLVMVETVGVGQSEAAVADMTDLYMLLVQPGAGDELQGIKRGVMERADIVVVTKADGALEGPAAHAKADFEAALSLHAGEGPWTPCVIACSSLDGTGLDEIADAVERHRTAMAKAGSLEARRAAQAGAWLWREVEDSLVAALHADERLAPAVAALEAEVAAQTLPPSAAARRIVRRLLERDA